MEKKSHMIIDRPESHSQNLIAYLPISLFLMASGSPISGS